MQKVIYSYAIKSDGNLRTVFQTDDNKFILDNKQLSKDWVKERLVYSEDLDMIG